MYCVLRPCLRTMAGNITERLKKHRLAAHTVQVKVRYGDFSTLTRQISVEDPLTEASDIYRLGCFLLGREKLVSRPLRLLGLGVANLGSTVLGGMAVLVVTHEERVSRAASRVLHLEDARLRT